MPISSPALKNIGSTLYEFFNSGATPRLFERWYSADIPANKEKFKKANSMWKELQNKKSKSVIDEHIKIENKGGENFVRYLLCTAGFFSPAVSSYVCLDNCYSPNKIFAHYCSLEALLNILNNQSCRYTDLAGMNDAQEKDKGNQIDHDVFVLCLSTLWDHLNLWRLYGDDCKGVSIQMEYTPVASDNPVSIPMPILYKNTSEYYLAEDLYKGSYKNELSRIEKDTPECFEDLTLGYASKRDVSLGFFVKAGAFAYEEEVRFIASLEKNEKPKHYYSPRTNSFRSYIDIPFEKMSIKIKKITLGPKASEPHIKQFIEDMLTKNGHKDIAVEYSDHAGSYR